MISYRLVRSKRKSISLQVLSGGEVVVRAPRNCPRDYIDRFVSQKESWIISRQETIHQYEQDQASFRPAFMECMNFCGGVLRVRPSREQQIRLDLDKMEIYFPDVSVEELLPGLKQIYRRAGLPFLQARVSYWAEIMGISYHSVRFSSALKRWGSCSAQGDIRITWLVLMAPLSAIDYILVHELCHRVHFDHSDAFWYMVSRFIPDYKEQKNLLLELSKVLYSQGWSKKYK